MQLLALWLEEDGGWVEMCKGRSQQSLQVGDGMVLASGSKKKETSVPQPHGTESSSNLN